MPRAQKSPILLSVKSTMTTTENTQITEVWNVIKGEQIIASGNTEKSAWKAVGCKNAFQRNELISHGFKIVKENSQKRLTINA